MGAKQGVSTGTAVAVIVIVLIIIGVVFMVGLKDKAPSQSPAAKGFGGMGGGGSQPGMATMKEKMQAGAKGQPAAGGEAQPAPAGGG